MIDLDSQKEIEKFDRGKILASIRLLPDQVEKAWEEVKNLEVPKECSLATNVVVCGMGGSSLGGRIVDSLIVDRVRTPVEVFTEYDIPYYVNEKSLVLVVSYSGNTEETLSCLKQAIDKRAQIFAITTDGKLAKLLAEEKLSGYVFNPRKNPSGQPRMGLGYTVSATLSLLARCQFIHLTDDAVYELVVKMRAFVDELDMKVGKKDNLAKALALKLRNRALAVIASEHLVGVGYAFKNQINENSKTFSTLFTLPELNHHLLEGLKHPAKARELLYFEFLKSELYRKEVLQRYDLTKEIVEKNGYDYGVFTPRSKTKLEQIFETLIFSSFVSFYLALVHETDPSALPWVDYFKSKLA